MDAVSSDVFRVFVSYRRDDSIGIAGRIRDRLGSHYGADKVFFELHSVPVGDDFVGYIDRMVAASDVVLVVIGRHWVDSVDALGNRCLEKPEDYVRREVEAALLKRVPVVPLLVDGATTPEPNQLPASLGRLARLHGIPIRPAPDFDTDIDRLLRSLDDRRNRHPKISIEVVHGDAFSVPCDVLALKWAQEGHGVDAAALQELVADRTIRDQSEVPRPWPFRHFARRGELGPARFLFVGIPPLRQFDYAEIRRFASKILGSLAGELPDTRRLALTLHGPGYGLDELACFEAELNGLLDSIRSWDLPRDLQEIAFVESDRGRAVRLDNYLGDYLGQAVAPSIGFVTPSVAEDLNTRRGAPGQSVSERPTAFVAMPFADEFDDTYNLGLQPSLHDQGYKCERMDQAHFVGDVVAEMR